MPAGEEDIARSIAIEKAAYGPNPISHIIFPGPPQPNADTAREQHMIEMRREDPEACQWIQAVDDERVAQGKHGMVSFCMGYLWRGTPKPPPARVWGPGTNPEACDAFFGGMNRIWEENMGSRPHFCKISDLKHFIYMRVIFANCGCLIRPQASAHGPGAPETRRGIHAAAALC